MSGICAIRHLDDRAAEPPEVAIMLEPLKRRGPDGSNITLDGPVGLGHALLATTPEAHSETLPLTHSGSGCAITADVRLDYRETLAERLGLPDQGKDKGDGELILLAYLQWGTRCLDHLRGDFAFAIWDRRDRTIFCARDQVGVRQLIYHYQPDKIFAFATEAQALMCHSSVPGVLDEGRIGDFFEDLEACDLTSTFFNGLHRLPPAHAMIVDCDGMRHWQYWSAQPQTQLRLPSDQAYADAFRAVFTEAVRSRLRSSGPIGSMLSGGMDSSSAAAVAAQLLKEAGQAPLCTFSANRSNRECVESNAIRAALEIEHIEPTLVSLEDFESYREDLSRLAREIDDPFDAHMILPRAVYIAAQRAGVKVVLDGMGGDTTLGSEPMIGWYLAQGKLLSAWREARGEARFWGEAADSWATHLRTAIRGIMPKRWLAQRKARYQQSQLQRAAEGSPLKAEFAARIDMAGRRVRNAATTAAPSDPEQRRIRGPFHPYVVVGRERYDRTAAQLAIEPRDPFLDLNVIEFCLSLPQEQLQHDGWPKVILRRAMRGLVPDAVRWRVGKEHLGPEFADALLDSEKGAATGTLTAQLQPFLNQETLQRWASRNECTDDGDAALIQVLALRYCAYWLVRVNAALQHRSSHD